MKLVVPYIGELSDLDARMVRLADFLGISWEILRLDNVAEHANFLEKTVPHECTCFVVNARVMKEWVGVSGIPAGLIAFLLSRFTHVLVHGVRLEAFDVEMVAALSRGRLKSVHPIDCDSPAYEFAKDSKDVCGPFAGLSFGPANPVNDHVFCVTATNSAVRNLISICGRPFMAVVSEENTEILFLASEDIAELESEVGDAPLIEYFSRFVPHVMALRYAAGDECWRPCKAHAAIIIDDPLLRTNYGFLNFESLLHLAEQYNFHTTIAFIPHNFRRNSSHVTRMFRENAARLSICFHGNDHTEAEFASTDLTLLNTLLRVAEERMNSHDNMSGVACSRVMVFPQGKFSMEAMSVLQSHNFLAAVNTVPHPTKQPIWLTIGELAQPAVLRYGNFPLFIRKPVRQTQSHDIAFNVFFGRPVLIVEHHEIFQRPESLVEVVARINRVAPDVHWSNLATVVANSILMRRAPDGTHHVRAYSGAVGILNDSSSNNRYSIEWRDSCDRASVEQVLVDGAPYGGCEMLDDGIRLSVDLAPGTSVMFSLVHRSVHSTVRNLSPRRHVQAFLRRRLSEVRDNYLSRNRYLLTAARALQRRIF